MLQVRFGAVDERGGPRPVEPLYRVAEGSGAVGRTGAGTSALCGGAYVPWCRYRDLVASCVAIRGGGRGSTSRSGCNLVYRCGRGGAD